ncbi:MAG: hypothetical protein HFJ28_02815 [Clostridia bacterium]|nr:hypothetical protein [Clostridia bacterium]
MITITAFTLSIIAAIMSFFEIVRLPSFIVAIFGIIFGVVAGYQKEKKEGEEKKKISQAMEIGSIIISGAVCVAYLVLLYIK